MPLQSRRFDLPLDWSVEQACAVLEFLEMLQDQLWILYRSDIQDHLRRQQSAQDIAPSHGDPSQPPF